MTAEIRLTVGRFSASGPRVYAISEPSGPATADAPAVERLARALREAELLDAAGEERARRLSEAAGERLDAVLAKLGLVSENDLASGWAQVLDLPMVEAYPQEPLHAEDLNTAFLKKFRVAPVAENQDGLWLAMADPLDGYAAEAVAYQLNRRVLRAVGAPTDIDQAIDRLYGAAGSEETAAAEIEDDEEDIARLKDLASEAPVIKLVNSIIGDAVEQRASDIHMEAAEDRLIVRYRLDGVLKEVDLPAGAGGAAAPSAAVASRIKIMAKLDIAERRLPQDGRIRMAARGRSIDLRVSTAPTLHGESVVLRILDRNAATLDWSAIGYSPGALDVYREHLAKPNGVILVTGPTGSGKTTTLYTSLHSLNSPERKIFSVEDPVEYQLAGINQMQVKHGIGLTFASGLRSILRQDPDVIMIGEIRDLETARIAIQAALTGHLVISTLHTISAAATISRLLDMGLEDYLIASTVTCVVAQRLVRRLCDHCAAPDTPSPELLRRMGWRGDAPARFRKPVGCPACGGRGFSGRIAIAEAMPMTETIRGLVLDRAQATEIERAAVAEGMTTLYQDGMAKAAAGVTTLDEVLRHAQAG